MLTEYKETKNTVEIRIKEPASVRILGLQFHLLNPLNKNPKEADMANDSYIMVFMLFSLKHQK